jgi:hypothetical protein
MSSEVRASNSRTQKIGHVALRSRIAESAEREGGEEQLSNQILVHFLSTPEAKFGLFWPNEAQRERSEF